MFRRLTVKSGCAYQNLDPPPKGTVGTRQPIERISRICFVTGGPENVPY